MKKRRFRTFTKKEYELLKSSGMMWVIYPEALDCYEEDKFVKCDCSGTNSTTCRVCDRAGENNSYPRRDA